MRLFNLKTGEEQSICIEDAINDGLPLGFHDVPNISAQSFIVRIRQLLEENEVLKQLQEKK